MNFEHYYTADRELRILHDAPATLAKWRQRGVGPQRLNCYGDLSIPAQPYP